MFPLSYVAPSIQELSGEENESLEDELQAEIIKRKAISFRKLDKVIAVYVYLNSFKVCPHRLGKEHVIWPKKDFVHPVYLISTPPEPFPKAFV
jgi:hypothetical protein